MEILSQLVDKVKQFPTNFSDSRFTANVIAVHGLVVVAILICLLSRRLLARGGRGLVERTGWKWIEPVVEEAMRHGRRLVLWLTVAAALVLIVSGTLYHRAGPDIRHDCMEWHDQLSREDWIGAGYHLGIVIGVLFAAWVGTRFVRRLRPRLEKGPLDWLACAGNEERLARLAALITRYLAISLWFVALAVIDGVEQP